MAQSTILAAGTTEATSTDVVVAAGAVVTIGIFVAAGEVPDGARFDVMIDTPGADVAVDGLGGAKRVTVLSGPCTARVVRRNAAGVSVGVFKED